MTALALRDDQTEWDKQQLAVLEANGIDSDVTEAELAAFLHECQRRKLDPFSRQIYLIGRKDKSKGRKVYRSQTSIDGFRLIARRAADKSGIDYSYEDTIWFDDKGGRHEVWLSPGLPAAAKVVVVRNGCRFDAVARFSAYVQTDWNGNPTRMWQSMPDVMVAKCFAADTEVLTDRGFRLFSQVDDARILQVTDHGLEAVDAEPFVQDYSGPMVVTDGDMLNFAVTPNHDMVTTFGKAEAGAIYATATTNYGPRAWRIPLTAPGRSAEYDISDDDLRLTGYIAADGWWNNYRLFNVAVSRSYKVTALMHLDPETTRIQHCSGAEAASDVRRVRSNFDKTVFTFPIERVWRLLDTAKRFVAEELLKLSQRQARILLDAWQHFDGYTNLKTGVRRIYTSNPDHVSAIEILAMLAGYTVSTPAKRESDISSREGFCLTLSEPQPQPLIRAGAARGPRGMHLEENSDGQVWCVTVPSGQIVVRRNGFAMVCGNCAEALALRKAFPEDLGGIYTEEEMAQADNPQRVTATVEVVRDEPSQQAAAPAEDPWLAAAMEAAPKHATLDDCAAVWRESSARVHAGEMDKADASRLQGVLRKRMEELKAAAEQQGATEGDEVVDAEIVEDGKPALDPEDPWAEKIADLGDEDDAVAARDEVAALFGSGDLTAERADQIDLAILARFPGANRNPEAFKNAMAAA